MDDSKNNTSDNLISIKQREITNIFLDKLREFLIKKRVTVDIFYDLLETREEFVSREMFVDKVKKKKYHKQDKFYVNFPPLSFWKGLDNFNCKRKKY